MEIDVYLKVIKRWALLILVMGVLAAGIAYYLVSKQPVSYTAQVQLLVGPGPQNATADINVLKASTTVMQTYVQLATTRNVMQQVIDKLHLNIGPNNLAGQVTATPGINTSMLTIAVHSGDPKQAVAIANAIGEVLVNLATPKADGSTSDSGLTLQAKQYQDQINRSQARVNQLQSDLANVSTPADTAAIAEQQKVIQGLEAQISAPVDPAIAKQMQDRQTRIQQLEAALASTTNLDARRLILDQLTREDNLLSTQKSQLSDQKRLLMEQLNNERNRLTDMQTAVNNRQNQIVNELTVERAQLADAQRGLTALNPLLQNGLSHQVTLIDAAANAPAETSKANLITGVAGLGGLVLGITLAFLLEFLDDRIRNAQELGKATGVRVWASIGKGASLLQPGIGSQALMSPADARIAEGFRQLCLKLMPSGSPAPCSLLITNFEQGDSAAEIASNLAITLARAGKRVLLVDANLKRPTLASWFQIENRKGLADYLSGASDDPGLVPVNGTPGLWVMPVGSGNGKNVQELVWPRMENLIERVQDHTDVLIVSGPPLSSSADALFLASHVGGVLAVAEKGKTHRRTATEVMENLHALGIQVLGVILADGGKSKMPVRLAPTLKHGGTPEKLASGNGKSKVDGNGNGASARSNGKTAGQPAEVGVDKTQV